VVPIGAQAGCAPLTEGCAVEAMRLRRWREGRKLVAIVDDDESMRRALVGLMKASGFPARSFASAQEFLSSGLLDQTACLIADIRMPGMSGLELQAKLNAERRQIPTIFITVQGDEKTRQQALSAGAVELFTKPFDDEVLLECVRAAMDR
jgi:FixJ family two-component response regulator